MKKCVFIKHKMEFIKRDEVLEIRFFYKLGGVNQVQGLEFRDSVSD